MKARILEKSQEHLWENFLTTHPLANIQQTPAWGHFQETIPSRGKYWIIVLEENEKIIGGTLIIRLTLPKKYNWLYSARGPLINYNDKNQLDALLQAIKPIAKNENAVFYRLDPLLLKLQKIPKFHRHHQGFQPEDTLILNLEPTEDEILNQMKPKGRYNIRLAEKKGVKIRKSDPNSPQFEKDIDAYHKIMLETTARDHFQGHRKNFYKNMVKILAEENKGALYIAESENQPIAAIITTFFKDTAMYYYGVSSNSHRNLMAPYLLQWQAIKDAKSQGLKYYDFLGIAPANAKNHPWKGVTEFKEKFGGQRVSYTMPQDYPFKKLLYLLYRVYKFLKK